MSRVVVTGAGGFVGHHLVNHLKDLGYWVRGVDIKHPWFEPTRADEFGIGDLREQRAADLAIDGATEVYALAADMGGMGYISNHHREILDSNLRINLNTLRACDWYAVRRVFFASSACVYPIGRQATESAVPLRETDAYPADPEDAYGWEKLTTEKLCQYYRREARFEARVARFHNVYGPFGTWTGGREKVPAALCRKIAEAKLSGNPRVEIWGDGRQTRSFCYVGDCVTGIHRLMRSDHTGPLNLGSDDAISVNALALLIAEIAETKIELVHVPGPQGVRGRNSDNSKCREVLGWTPNTTIEAGLRRTYPWIEEQVRAAR